MKLERQNKIRHTKSTDYQIIESAIYALHCWFSLAGPNVTTSYTLGELYKFTASP